MGGHCYANRELTDAAVTWFKNELELPENNKVLVFFVRYGGEFQLKQGFSPAFTVEPKEDVDIGYEQQYDDLNVVVAEKDLWYFEDDHIIVNVVDHEDEISYSTK
ncbi:HesB/YadR/YfhF family protein [Staphylococcus aureus]